VFIALVLKKLHLMLEAGFWSSLLWTIQCGESQNTVRLFYNKMQVRETCGWLLHKFNDIT
jgi:hypothetical protein